MQPAIHIQNLTLNYQREETINNVSLKINKGEFVYIIGPNGGGKTTLIKAVLGLISPAGGNITLNQRKIGYVPQKSEISKDFPITVSEAVQTAFLKAPLNPFKYFRSADRKRAMEYLKLLGLEDLAGHQIGALSGGEFQRVLIARALARNPELLILDEPCANTDTASSRKIHEILDKENSKGVTVVVISHDINHVLHSKRRTVFINKTILFDDIADERVLKL